MTTEVAPEGAIDTFQIDFRQGDSCYYLMPSPELYMKRLLASGAEKIFQLSPVFRKGERGRFHLPGFTMLEWYRKESDYLKLMEDCEGLVRTAAKAAGIKDGVVNWQGIEIEVDEPFRQISVEKAFRDYAGWSPGPKPDPERFNHDMAFRVEPCLPSDRPVFLMDYPASEASLARLKPGNPDFSERVELYMAGVELANGFSELIDPVEQEKRFRKENKERERLGMTVYNLPSRFLDAMKYLPPCAGMALGIDRLTMLLNDAHSITQVIAFPPDEES